MLGSLFLADTLLPLHVFIPTEALFPFWGVSLFFLSVCLGASWWNSIFFFSLFALFISPERDLEQCFLRSSILIASLLSPANTASAVWGGERHSRDFGFFTLCHDIHMETQCNYSNPPENQAIMFDSVHAVTSAVSLSHQSRCDASMFGIFLSEPLTSCCPASNCTTLFCHSHFGPRIKMVVFVLFFFYSGGV